MNEYSARWFEVFLPIEDGDGAAADAVLAKREVDALARFLPLPAFRRVLDLCCGPGRHSRWLAEPGYAVVGVERDGGALARARAVARGARFVQADQRDLASVLPPRSFDAVVCLWQSFGLFDQAGNDAVLADLALVLRPGGRLLFDLFRAGWVAARAGAQPPSVNGTAAVWTPLGDGLWLDEITYPDGVTEVMRWELFEPEALAARAARFGFEQVELTASWTRPLHRDDARFQLILQLDESVPAGRPAPAPSLGERQAAPPPGSDG